MSSTPSSAHPEHDASFGAARDGIAVLAPDWRIRYMNASMLEILRLIGRGADISTLWEALPDWEHSSEADALRGAMESGAAVCFRVDGARGRGRVWEVQADPLDSGELRVRLRNVTGQARLEQAELRYREAGGDLAVREARLDALLSAAPVGIVLFDADTLRVREASAFFHGLLEEPWRTPGSIAGRHPSEFFPPFEQAGLDAIFARVRDSAQPFEIAEFEHVGADRGTAWFRLTLNPVAQAGGGSVQHLLLVLVEITPEVRARHAAEAQRQAR